MRTHSIAQRVMVLFLLAEILSALAMTGFVFAYERHTHFHSYDVALHGRAEMLLGAVVDAEDVDDHVVLDMEGVHLPEGDLYEVWDNGHTLLGRTPGWAAPTSLLSSPRDREEIRIGGKAYRAVRVSGLRRVDPDASSVLHTIVVVYAAPAWPIWRPVLDAVRAFALASSVLVVLSTLLVIALVRRSMQPIQLLAEQASAISSSHWQFSPPINARHTRELAPLIVALEDLVARLQTAFAQQRQFVSDSAHELKTAITVVKSSLQLLELRPRNAEEYRVGVGASLEDCQRMEDLVQRMLTLARVEEADVKTVLTVAPLTELRDGIELAMSFVASLAALRQVRLECEASAALYAAIPLEDWTTLLGNLLSNAVQHSRPGSRVLIRLAQNSAWATCTVVDRGAGITPEALPHVFHRFYRGDASRARATGGTGLGLAICKAIAERCGGRVSVESCVGEGTTVTIALPLSPGQLAPLSTEAMQSTYSATA